MAFDSKQVSKEEQPCPPLLGREHSPHSQVTVLLWTLQKLPGLAETSAHSTNRSRRVWGSRLAWQEQTCCNGNSQKVHECH